MAYGYIHDEALGRARWTVDSGKILDEDGTQVGTERDGVAYHMSGEVWGALNDLNGEAPSVSPAAPPAELPDP